MTATIVIINYNDKVRIKRCIESALNQTYKDTQVIVVDDGSDNETREIYKAYKGIELIQLERDDITLRTPSRARNAGIEACKGDYISFLDSDNYISKDFISKMIKHDKDVMFCNWDIVGLQDYKVRIERVWDFHKPILENYLKFQHMDHQCLLIKKSYLDTCGYYDLRLPRSQDCDLISRLILKGGEWVHVQDVLFFFEKHEQDQGKEYASVHGKTLWTLKNNINISWLLGLLNDPIKILCYMRAIQDFVNNPEWADDYNASEFKNVYEQHEKLIDTERKEG